MNTRYDCVICGAGPAGSMLAYKLALTGLSVCIIDKLPPSRIGHTWDVAVEKDIFARVGMRIPENLLLEQPQESRFYVSDPLLAQSFQSVSNTTVTLSHNRLNDHLLSLARAAGAAFWSNSTITGYEPGVEGGVVEGFRRGFLGKHSFKISAPMLVDATGVAAVLRKHCPDDYLIKHQLRRQDFAIGHHQVREVRRDQLSAIEDNIGLVPGSAAVRIGHLHGYSFVHLRTDGTASLLFGSAYNPYSRDVHPGVESFLSEYPFFGKVIKSGGGMIPIRRSLDTLVGDGFLCVGDSACQVVPTMGSGIASSLHAAQIASETIIGAFNKQDLSRASLWVYNEKYQRKRGAIMASYDILRRFLQSLSAAELEGLFSAGVFQDENLVSTFGSNAISYDIVTIFQQISRFLKNLNLLQIGFRFLQVFSDAEKAYSLYKKYPDQNERDKFRIWQHQTDTLFSHYKTFSNTADEFLI